MIRRLFARLLSGASKPARAARVYGASDHPLRRDQIAGSALQVTRRLQEAGFKAFVVGGAVRDLLLGIVPKDYDIATDAEPEQVKPLFRRAFLIGRRFRLVHVHVGGDAIEVSTFRAPQGDDAADEHGRLLSDNVYGTQAEDAARRDFTINALYFDPAAEEIWDYVGGVADIRARRLKLIGPPTTRYREDPVRMLRAVRLAAKLGIAIEAKTAAPISKLAPLMQNVPPARLFDEMQKLLLSGHAAESLRSLREHGLSHGLLPLLDVVLEHRRTRARRPRRVAGIPVRHAAVARGPRHLERGQGEGRATDSGALRCHGLGARAPGKADRDTASVRGHDQGDLVAAAAFRATLGTAPLSFARAPPVSCGLGFPGAARQER
jgi:poly(A) polymerase